MGFNDVALTNDLLRGFMQVPGAFRMIVCDDATAARLLGAEVHLGEMHAVAWTDPGVGALRA